MSSSTSSSSARARRWRWQVPLGLLVIFGALEIFTRTRLFDTSKDFRRFAGYGEKAQRLEPAHGVRIALIGNSATDPGLNLPVPPQTFEGAGRHPTPGVPVHDA